MEATIYDQESISSWNRERSTEELRSYVLNKLTSLPDFDVE
jgi:hypothetical protein